MSTSLPPSVDSKERSSKYWLPVALLLLSLAVRFGASYFLTHLDAEPRHDELIYTGIGRNLASGNGYSVNGESPTARRAPGYPLLLVGVFFVFGESWIAARVVNILLSSLTVGVVYLIGCRLFNRKIGFIAGLISALYPAFIQNSLRMFSDTLFVLVVSVSFLVFLKIHERPNALAARVIGGTLIGVAILTRSEFVLFIPFLFIWILEVYGSFRAALRAFAIILTPVLLLLLPWLVRNYAVFDQLMLASNFGRVLWCVHNPDTFTNLNLMGDCDPPSPDIRSAGDVPADLRNPAFRYLPEPEWNQQQIALALTAIKQNIRTLPKLALYKLHRLIFSVGKLRDFLRLPLLYCFFFGLILLVASGDKRLLVFYMFLLFATCSTLIFFTSERLRMSTDLVMIVIASYGLIEQIKLIGRLRGRRVLSPQLGS